MTELSINQVVLERYVIEGFLDVSETATAYKARHVSLGTSVMVRVADPHAVKDTSRFGRSARLMARIRDPHVVSILAYGLIEGAPCIVTEWGGGTTLRQHLEEHGAMPWPQAVEVGRRVFLGLAAIHAAAVLHRNLKPENVGLVAGPSLCKLIDLGLAKSTEPDDATQITEDAIAIGTPIYMSPEQIRRRDLDARSDLYSGGLVLYEMLTGDVPNGRTPSALARREKFAPRPPMPPENLPRLMPELVELVDQLLQPDPERRPTTAWQVANALAAITRSARAQSKADPEAAQRDLRTKLPSRPYSAKPLRLQANTTNMALDSVQKPPPTEEPKAPDAAEPYRPRAVIAARLPPELLEQRQIRGWLSSQIGSRGKCWRVGDSLWVAILWDRSDQAAQGQLMYLMDLVRDRYHRQAKIAGRLLDDSFTLSEATLRGSASPPVEVILLLEDVSA